MAMDYCCWGDLNVMFENATTLLYKKTRQSAKRAISSSNDVALLANGILSSNFYIPPHIIHMDIGIVLDLKETEREAENQKHLVDVK